MHGHCFLCRFIGQLMEIAPGCGTSGCGLSFQFVFISFFSVLLVKKEAAFYFSQWPE